MFLAPRHKYASKASLNAFNNNHLVHCDLYGWISASSVDQAGQKCLSQATWGREYAD